MAKSNYSYRRVDLRFHENKNYGNQGDQWTSELNRRRAVQPESFGGWWLIMAWVGLHWRMIKSSDYGSKVTPDQARWGSYLLKSIQKETIGG